MCAFQSPEDTKGCFYTVATAFGARAWTNPHTAGSLTVTASSVASGSVHLLVEPQTHAPHVLFTDDVASSWMSVDLGERTRVSAFTHYTMRHGGTGAYNFPRSWRLEASVDGAQWHVLDEHKNDQTFATGSQRAHWALPGAASSAAADTRFRHVRVVQTGPTSDNDNFLALGSLEVYGTLHKLDS